MAVAERIYAKALFDAAKDAGRLPQVRGDLAELVEAAEASPELHGLLQNPQIDRRAKQAGLDAVFGDAEAVFRNFLRLLTQKSRLGQVAEIRRQFERLVAEEERILEVELVDGPCAQPCGSRRDHREDRAGIGAKGRGHAVGRPLAHRRHGAPCGLVPGRRERSRPPQLTQTRARSPRLNTKGIP